MNKVVSLLILLLISGLVNAEKEGDTGDTGFKELHAPKKPTYSHYWV
jgi:hypothetical protein